MSTLIGGTQNKINGVNNTLAKSKGVSCVVGAIPVGNPYKSPNMPASRGGVANLGGTGATNIRITKNGQIY